MFGLLPKLLIALVGSILLSQLILNVLEAKRVVLDFKLKQILLSLLLKDFPLALPDFHMAWHVWNKSRNQNFKTQ